MFFDKLAEQQSCSRCGKHSRESKRRRRRKLKMAKGGRVVACREEGGLRRRTREVSRQYSGTPGASHLI